MRKDHAKSLREVNRRQELDLCRLSIHTDSKEVTKITPYEVEASLRQVKNGTTTCATTI